jgi:hypothetical protein
MLSYPKIKPTPCLYYNYIPSKHVITSCSFPASSLLRLTFYCTPVISDNVFVVPVLLTELSLRFYAQKLYNDVLLLSLGLGLVIVSK